MDKNPTDCKTEEPSVCNTDKANEERHVSEACTPDSGTEDRRKEEVTDVVEVSGQTDTEDEQQNVSEESRVLSECGQTGNKKQ